MKGIILAGGSGSRLYPLTIAGSKQLLPVYDKPMIYYPLTTLIEGGISEICIITTPDELPRFRAVLRNGSHLGLNIEYRTQASPAGIAQALIIAEEFIDGGSIALILGDNLFFGPGLADAFGLFRGGATIFGYHVADPERYGVVTLDHHGRPLAIEEKPVAPRSSLAVTGVYLYDHQALQIAKSLRPSARGELEITDVNRAYLEMNQLNVKVLRRGFAWLDAGTVSSLHETSCYVQAIERRQGIKIGCPEEAAFRRELISRAHLQEITLQMPACEYRDYLADILNDSLSIAQTQFIDSEQDTI